MSTRTPWGPSQSAHKITRGLTFHSTAGHGGFKVSPSLLAKMPQAWRHPNGWYEEDCEASLVVLAFPHLFTPKQHESALASAKNWFPDDLLAAGIPVSEEESLTLRQRRFDREHAHHYVVHGAWGDWHPDVPEGMVGVCGVIVATREEAYFLVPKDEYTAPRHGLPFVIDPARHSPCPLDLANRAFKR